MTLYYLIIIFGLLLFAYTAISLSSAKKKVNQHDNSFKKLSEYFDQVKLKVTLWKYYFTAGNERNFLRNILLTIIIFFFFHVLNYLYLKIDKFIFLAVFIFLFLTIVWKLGQRRNRKEFEEMFPEVIQILNSATSSGAGLLQALERCGKDISGQIGEEFTNVHKRLAIGEDPTSVFEDSYTRYPYKEYYFFITIIRVNLDKGGQMREVIMRLGRVIADSKKMEKKKSAMTSEARMSAMIVASFPVAFFIFMKFMMPENFDFLLNDPGGRMILYYVLGSEVLGMLIIWWLMRKAT
ncbi:type II secretion system F family protein [Bisgaard Taxon 10/6]|uniref:Type II secretion system F family protein n=1 Tax=Exercitatus varius TaxID=67857 RepID=A0AAW6QFL4_9PAST|nr:type II secretion system F family protein [Exercitatus varius]QOF67724.1 type II secretion system F family protein [Actinobacillus sp. GY-402]MDG2918520.1 type II secretion system F family protein [Exercitatus varius]MDG2940406.1 type II secretion system F family protein [Exercitatus varius]MDG2942719.1 type II secretion system F family protein [Exercitatus varius]MDG2946830.1 type II secretion system F family protein [Exercitatus varius]